MNGVAPAPGTMRLYPTQPNSAAAGDKQLFLLSGDATTRPIQNLELASGVALPPAPTALNFNLRIFHFNDLHGHLMRFSPAGESSVLPRIAGKIRSARRESQGNPTEAVLVFSAGDDCTGSIFDEILMDSRSENPVHPGYQLYSKLGLDAAGLGNHDLDRGAKFLADSIHHNAQFPVLAANLAQCPQLTGLCHPAALLVVNGLRIGLIGLVTRAETNLAEHQIVHPVTVAQNLVPALRPICDVLIIMSHIGYSLDSPVPMADAGDVELAQSLSSSSVDLIIGGHSHTALNENGLLSENVVNGIPIVQTGARGEHLGAVELQVTQEGAKVTDVQLIPTQSLPEDATFVAEMQPFITRARELWNQPVGQVDDLPDLNTQIILSDFAKREMALANFVTDALVEQMTHRGFAVDFAMIDASALQCGLPYSDNLTFGDCFEVMPYADTIRLYHITGRQLQALLADNALRLDNPGHPDAERGFLQFSQAVRYTIIPGDNAKNARVSDVMINKTPIAELEHEEFIVATSSFIRRLAEPWVTECQHNEVCELLEINQYPYTDTDFLLRSEIVAYIKKLGGVTRKTGAHRDGRLIIKPTKRNNHKEHQASQSSIS